MAHALTIECLDPGGGAFLVDDRRYGRRAEGLPAGGPADARALAAANELLGQRPLHPGLELTLTGGRWLLSGRGQFVLAGADLNLLGNGRPLETYHVHDLDGDLFLIGRRSAGASLRTYIAVNGQWEVPAPTNPALPYAAPLPPGWRTTVTWTEEAPFRSSLDTRRHQTVSPLGLPVRPGPEWDWLTVLQQHQLLTAPYRVSTSSNRQGLRLEGGPPVPDLPSLLSSPVLPGTVQLSPAGPILLGPEAQTVGGYPRVLLLAEPSDLGAAYQLALGGELRWRLMV